MSIKWRVILCGSLIFVFAALLVVICPFTAGNKAQAEEPEPSFYVADVFGAKGRQIEAPIMYEALSKMEGVEFILTYDPAILEPVDVIADTALPLISDGGDDTFQVDLTHTNSSISVAAAWVGTDGVNDYYPPLSGEFCRVVFKLLQGGPPNDPKVANLSLSSLVVAVVETAGGVNSVVEIGACSLEGGQVDAYEVVYGDTNMDNTISAQDARLALRYYLSLEQVPPIDYQTLAADVNGDGKVNAVDARLILRRYLNLEPLFPVEALN